MLTRPRSTRRRFRPKRRANRARAPTYEELWREPRRLAASISVAPAPKDRLPGWAAVVAILMGVSALIALREKIVDVAPPAAKVFAAIGLPVNLAGLELREVRSHIEMDGARKVLAVEGEIANMRRESRSVPPVALTVRGEDGQAKYAWTTRAAKSRLEPGETIAFRARLASPPESGADVLVRFSSLEEAAAAGGCEIGPKFRAFALYPPCMDWTADAAIARRPRKSSARPIRNGSESRSRRRRRIYRCS